MNTLSEICNERINFIKEYIFCVNPTWFNSFDDFFRTKKKFDECLNYWYQLSYYINGREPDVYFTRVLHETIYAFFTYNHQCLLDDNFDSPSVKSSTEIIVSKLKVAIIEINSKWGKYLD